MKYSLLALAVTVALLAGCASPLPLGTIYSEFKFPVSATANNTAGMKKGTAMCTSILGMVATGDASIEAAKRNGGITKVTHVDRHVKNILGFYGEYTTIVYGE